MDDHILRKLLDSVQLGTVEVDEAISQLRSLPYEQVGDFARVDHHRNLRCGFPEVIFGSGKNSEQIIKILHTKARAITLGQLQERDLQPGVLVITAGTADIPVAEEAALTAEMTGSQVERLYDVGVAGLHRLLDKAQTLQQANVIVVAAGMEGALASVVGWIGKRTCDRRANQRGLRSQLQRAGSAPGHVEHLCTWGSRGEYR
jgi:pyridinium-3,5-biscarboxylic acid mononucleotide synthase